MALHIEWGWDFAVTGNTYTLDGSDAGGAWTAVTFTTGTYTPGTSLSAITEVSGYTSFAAALETAINAASSDGTYTVTWSYLTGYTFTRTAGAGNFTMTLAGTTPRTNMAAVIGMTGNRSGATTYSSQVRPYYNIIPSIQGRSHVNEREAEDLAEESIADDGTSYMTARHTTQTHLDWVQMAEPTTLSGAVLGDEWTPPYIRQGVTNVPWTYQHAFRHARNGNQPFAVIDGSTTWVCKMRAEGVSFAPQRFAGTDIEIFSIPFMTRLLGTF